MCPVRRPTHSLLPLSSGQCRSPASPEAAPCTGKTGPAWEGAEISPHRAGETRPLTRARGDAYLPERRPPATFLGSMAGSPLKRARKQGVRLEDGSVIGFPYRPAGGISAAQKIEHLIGLDRCHELLSWGSITELDPLRRSFQMQVLHVMLPIGIKAALDGGLDRDAVIEELASNLANFEGQVPKSLRPHNHRQPPTAFGTHIGRSALVTGTALHAP